MCTAPLTLDELWMGAAAPAEVPRTRATSPLTLVSTVTGPVAVCPDRLETGHYDHDLDDYVNQGDIYASYSGESLTHTPSVVRNPFQHGGETYVCVGMTFGGMEYHTDAKAYRLIPRRYYTAQVSTYEQKCKAGDRSRRDPMGFCNGVRALYRKEEYILVGPPVIFQADPSIQSQKPEKQLTLF